jgi:hypothetical protein
VTPETAITDLMRVNEFAWELYNSNPKNETKRNMNQDIYLLVNSFKKHNVEYILIGGFAMAFYGHIRATNDIDLWIKNTPKNMANVTNALIESGIPEARVLKDTNQLAAGFAVFNMMESDFKIDLFHDLKAFKEVDFDSCYARVTFSEYKGISIPVLQAADLLHEKEMTAREKDMGDISFLRRMMEKLTPGKKPKGPKL